MTDLGFGGLRSLAVVAVAFGMISNANAQVVSAAHVVDTSQVAWDSTPSTDDLKSLYNFGANGRAVNASTAMRCELQVDGSLANCAIMRESPGGFAFGAASIRAGKLYRAKMTETLQALVAAGGVSIIIPFTWSP